MALHTNVIIYEPGESARMSGNVENSIIGTCIYLNKNDVGK